MKRDVSDILNLLKSCIFLPTKLMLTQCIKMLKKYIFYLNRIIMEVMVVFHVLLHSHSRYSMCRFSSAFMYYFSRSLMQNFEKCISRFREVNRNMILHKLNLTFFVGNM